MSLVFKSNDVGSIRLNHIIYVISAKLYFMQIRHYFTVIVIIIWKKC